MNIELLLTQASKLKIAVIGDFIEDRYIIGAVDRISPEAPVPVVNQHLTFSKPGGAGNVYMNLCNLGIETHLFCNTHDKYTLTTMTHHEKGKVYSNQNRHAIKTRVMSGSHHLLRIDEELDPMQIEWLAFREFSWWKELEEKMGEYNCIVMSDYGKGVLSDSVINGVMELAIHYKIPVVVDAKRDFKRYKGATVIKCNQKEYEALPLDVYQFNPALRFGAKHFIVTCGEMGMTAYSEAGHITEGINAHSVNIVDVCGAGDTVTAILAMMTGINESVQPACELANIAASEVCCHVGVHAITKEELIKRFNEVKS
jgi:rfaE bifunctional protein kinase chain/domain